MVITPQFVLLNIIGKLELIYCFTSISTVVPSNICKFLSCRPFVVITFSTGLVGVEVTSVSWLGQLAVGSWSFDFWENL